MMVTFGYQTLTGSAQPLFSDEITAALPVPLSTIDPILTVADTTIYEVGFRLVLEPGTANQDLLRVSRILSSTTMQCSYEGATPNAHAVNSVIALAVSAAELVVQPKSGNANSVFLGKDNTVTSAGAGHTFAEVVPGYPYRMTNSGQYNTVLTTDVWVAGTASQTFLASALVI